MKTILKLVLVFGFSATSYASDDIASSYCSHYGEGVSYSFQSCVNSNFSDVARKIGGYFSHCSNYGKEVSYSFTSCVNSGFREAERQLDNKVWLQSCSNYDRTSLDYSFVSCVNSNFSQIQRAIDRLPAID